MNFLKSFLIIFFILISLNIYSQTAINLSNGRTLNTLSKEKIAELRQKSLEKSLQKYYEQYPIITLSDKKEGLSDDEAIFWELKKIQIAYLDFLIKKLNDADLESETKIAIYGLFYFFKIYYNTIFENSKDEIDYAKTINKFMAKLYEGGLNYEDFKQIKYKSALEYLNHKFSNLFDDVEKTEKDKYIEYFINKKNLDDLKTFVIKHLKEVFKDELKYISEDLINNSVDYVIRKDETRKEQVFNYLLSLISDNFSFLISEISFSGIDFQKFYEKYLENEKKLSTSYKFIKSIFFDEKAIQDFEYKLKKYYAISGTYISRNIPQTKATKEESSTEETESVSSEEDIDKLLRKKYKNFYTGMRQEEKDLFINYVKAKEGKKEIAKILYNRLFTLYLDDFALITEPHQEIFIEYLLETSEENSNKLLSAMEVLNNEINNAWNETEKPQNKVDELLAISNLLQKIYLKPTIKEKVISITNKVMIKVLEE